MKVKMFCFSFLYLKVGFISFLQMIIVEDQMSYTYHKIDNFKKEKGYLARFDQIQFKSKRS